MNMKYIYLTYSHIYIYKARESVHTSVVNGVALREKNNGKFCRCFSLFHFFIRKINEICKTHVPIFNFPAYHVSQQVTRPDIQAP